MCLIMHCFACSMAALILSSRSLRGSVGDFTVVRSDWALDCWLTAAIFCINDGGLSRKCNSGCELFEVFKAPSIVKNLNRRHVLISLKLF